ncbi:fungal-specific transcription factor domain-containing protein [Fusarium flagelliforme]|uniref:fungal-specific transcription factor domain-containing protein n=1 Tax=Fusarium flagelliforme TaxID=2675880 RepID=UPI001E8E64E4|nr:fungal-specific transcription factor domain-containing protein [Fusarium flagelliforme]KAH7196500.1 fungal-specific transcription factor domain-containing protein [Fusarium flagelliforme]
MTESTNTSDSRPSSVTPGRTRVARVACKACHARRVKCDAGEGQPCWHCRTRGSECELIESKRGKYARRSNVQSKQQRSSRRLQQTQSPAHRQDETPNVESIAVMTPQSNEVAQYSTQPQNPEPIVQPDFQPQTQSNLSQVKDRSYFLGDSSSLSYIVELICTPRGGVSEPVKVHYPIPASIVDRAVAPSRPQIEPLRLQDALTLPSKDIMDRLIYIFFDTVHPPWPVVDRRLFLQSYKAGQASTLLLHAMFVVTYIFCEEDLIKDAGFSDRVAARKHHYLRAKTLYDVDHETDRDLLAASLHLLGFWWNGPDDQKDAWFWLGCATSYAQSLGLHRSTVTSRLSPEKRALRKRIWWSIYTRDRHTAACLGKPCRIRDEDCDIEPPTEADLYYDDVTDDPLIPPQNEHQTAFFLEMRKAAEILGDIVIGEFSPRRIASERYEVANLKRRLEEWEVQLPKCMQIAPLDETRGAAFWATQLHMAYQNYFILLFRPKAIHDLSPAQVEGDIMARRAADTITRMTEDLIAVGTLRYVQMHIIPAVFGALSIHTLVICRKDPIRRQLAGNKSRQCILALSELAKSWPIGLWITKFFVNLFRRLTGQGSAVSAGSIVDVTSRIARANEDNASGEVGSQNLAEALNGFNQQASFSNGDGSMMEPPGDMLYPDQFGFDSFWAEDTIDVDLLLQHGLCPLLPPNFGPVPPGSLGL